MKVRRYRSKRGAAEELVSDRVTLSHEELSLLLGGIDLRQTRQKNWYRVTVSVDEKS